MRNKRPIQEIKTDLLTEFDDLNERAGKLLDNLDDAAFNRQPEPGKWSVGECFEHLNVTGELYWGKIKEIIDEAEKTGAGSTADVAEDFKPGFLMRKFIDMMEPPVKSALKSPKVFKPEVAESKSLDREKTVNAFITLNGKLKEALEKSIQLKVFTAKFVSPASSLLRPRVLEGFMIITAHGRRHLEQAEKIAG